MHSSGEVFGLVAMSDPQRRVPPGTLWASACNLVTPPEFRQAPRAAHSIAARGTVADRYISADPQRHRFVAAFQDAALILRVLGCPPATAPPIAARRWSGDRHDGRRSQAQDLSSRAAPNQSGYFLRQLWMESAEDMGDRLQSRTSRNRRSFSAFGCKGIRKGRYGLGCIKAHLLPCSREREGSAVWGPRRMTAVTRITGTKFFICAWPACSVVVTGE